MSKLCKIFVNLLVNFCYIQKLVTDSSCLFIIIKGMVMFSRIDFSLWIRTLREFFTDRTL